MQKEDWAHYYLLPVLLKHRSGSGCCVWPLGWDYDVKPLLAAFLTLAAAASLGGCAAKTVIPVQMAQPGDETLDCAALADQIAQNELMASDFVKKDQQVQRLNTARNVGSVIPGLGLLLVMSTDLSNDEQIRGRALVDRDERLRFLAKHKRCTP